MKNLYQLVTILILCVSTSSIAQSIRKNYNEMTQSERDALVAAFYQLRNGADLIDDLATFHNNSFNAIHFNPLATDVFLAWHRRQIFEMEQAMQDINPNISIPFWDWTTDNSVNSPLWDNNFLGQFDSDWNLGRDLGSGSLPTATDVANVQAINNWVTYYDDLETGIVHVGAHIWVALPPPTGIMAGGASPRDPVFYLHHGMVDKLWQDWEEANGSSIFQRTDMPRYDGTYSFDGQTLPSVNPNDIVDSKALGVFFAENQLAALEDYTVSNTYRSQENFYYQYTIEANDFIVPSGNNCKMESTELIVLEPGFHAQNGSTFTAKMDTDNNIGTQAKGIIVERNQKPFSKIDIVENAYVAQDDMLMDADITIHPNPANEYITISLPSEKALVKVTLYDIQGRAVITTTDHTIPIRELSEGVYLAAIQLSDGERITKKVIISRE